MAIACDTAPVPTRSYVLDMIDGRTLPTASNAGAAGDTTVVYGGAAVLDGRGHALVVERRRSIWKTWSSPEMTDTSRFDYVITGDSITLGTAGGCTGLCPRFIGGGVSDSSLTLDWGDSWPTGPVFHYQREGWSQTQ
jgi:hypothetical protein